MKEWITKSGCRISRILAGRSNVFLLSQGDRQILVDSGPPQNREKLEHGLDEKGVSHLDYLILTHTHFDHAGNARWIREKYHAKVIVHAYESDFLGRGDNVPMQGKNLFIHAWFRLLTSSLGNLTKYEPCTSDLVTESYFSLKEAGFNAFIMHTPGHTRGSQCVIVDDEIAFVGDCMFGVVISSVYPPFAEDYALLVNSWRKLLETHCKIFLASHGEARSRTQLERALLKRVGQK